MMDMFQYAKEFDTDYYDPVKCVVYKVHNYNNAKKLGISNNVPGIEIVDLEGNNIDYIPEMK